MTSLNGNIFRVTGHLCGQFTGHRWIPRTKSSDMELWCFLRSAPWIDGWVNNREAGILRRHRALRRHCNVKIGLLFQAISRVQLHNLPVNRIIQEIKQTQNTHALSAVALVRNKSICTWYHVWWHPRPIMYRNITKKYMISLMGMKRQTKFCCFSV